MRVFDDKFRAKSGILSRDLGIFKISWEVLEIFILKAKSPGFFRIPSFKFSILNNLVF